MGNVAQWLDQLGVGQYASVFADNDIDEDVLVDLSDSDLEKLGVTLGHRKKILKAIAAHRARQSAGAQPLGTPSAVPEAERRQLTVMFCDLVGSTELSQRLDPEDLRDINRAYQDACKASVEKYEGFVARYMGDGVLAYFGYPRAHEDDAERGVRAGLEVITAMDGVNAGIGRDKAAELAVRVGLATGPVVVGDLIGEGASQESVVVGETPNLAARLQGLAASNAVVVAPDTHRLTAGHFRYRDLGERTLKGIARPVRAWQVLGEGGAGSRFEALHGRRLTPLVGRGSEVDRLAERWARAIEGNGQAVLISGEAGVGKSRLCAALEARIAGEAYTRMGYQCSAHHMHSALYPVIDQLERAAGFDAHTDTQTRLDRLEHLLGGSDRALDEDLPLLAALLSIPATGRGAPLEIGPREQKERTLEALIRHVEGLCADRPVLVVFEDLHWVDASTIELLDRLVERARELPVLVLATFRTEFSASWVDHEHVTTLRLSPIREHECRTLLDAVVGAGALPERIVKEIVAKTDGIPLYIEETARAVSESQTVTGGHIGDDAHLEVPSTLQDSLMARLDRLALGKQIAQMAGAIGREFTRELVASITDLSASDLDRAIEELIDGGVIFRRGSGADASYVFEHALLQDAAYSSLLLANRKPLHRRIAEALTTQAPEQAAVLAYHWESAEDFEKALDCRLQAARQASDLYAMSEATAQNLHALELLDRLPETPERLRQHLEALLDVVRIWGLTGSVSWQDDEEQVRARRHLEKAVLTARADGEFASLARLEAFIGVHWGEESYLARAVEAADASADKSVQAEVSSRYSGYLGQRGRFEDSYVHTDRTIELFGQLGDKVQQGMSLVGEGRCFSARSGRIDDSLRYAARAREIAEQTQDLRLKSWIALESEPYMYKGLWEETIRGTEDGLSLAYQTEDWLAVLFASAWAAIACVKLGRLDEAERYIDEALTSVEDRVGLDYPRAYLHSVTAQVQLARGDTEAALASAGAAVRLAEDGGFVLEQGAANRVLGQVHEAMGNRTDAETAYGRSLEQLGAIQSRPELAQSLLAYGRFKRTENAQEGERLLEQALEMFREMDATGWISETETALES
jgi:class 3 adenylate cyclase/tetratricopeptide (TPR) repeat protein